MLVLVRRYLFKYIWENVYAYFSLACAARILLRKYNDKNLPIGKMPQNKYLQWLFNNLSYFCNVNYKIGYY